MNLLNQPLSSFNPRKQLFGETTPPEFNRYFRNFSSTINWRKIILQKKSKIPIIPFFSILLNLQCFWISLGVQDELDIGNVQYYLYKLWDNKDTE